ncbi:hypothetical protein B0H17DRAFT_1079511 [Mycena rosella]|uniref:MYND-type domain-containing protein n=1 Tax=Mycena rosella TaxID=1033263 RepID=A0AAD7D442_MYCRO|nr:hypothetical protein B0H17DRAFT_1079511 [Mycena rosella]
MPRKLSKPLLPAELVKKIQSDDMMSGFVSDVFSRNAHDNRMLMRNWEAPYSPDFYIQDLSIGFVEQMKRTAIHLAAYDGDVLAVYEILGLGATADKPDSSGITPICLAVVHLAMVTSPHARGMRPDGGMMNALDFKREASRLELVIQILVEQHAVLDRTIEGEPLINILCRAKAWDTIALFLMHGATPPRNLPSLFPAASERSRFTSMLQSRLRPGASRPARICPCWSGKTVANCHAKEAQPYPLTYVCVCGSGKTYESCCFHRRAYVLEKWNPTLNRIMHDYDRVTGNPMLKGIRAEVERMQEQAQACGMEIDERLLMPGIKPGKNAKKFDNKHLSEELLGKGLIDPAFAYAQSRVDFAPKPQARKISRHTAEHCQKRWNAWVDEYIDTQRDPRSRKEIERAAKIGTWNGALIRICEGPDCRKVEGTDVERLKSCSKCKMSVYCGSDCQKRAWKAHKTKCGKEEQCEQSLPSQDAVHQHLNRMVVEVGKKYQELLANPPPLEILARLSKEQFPQ